MGGVILALIEGVSTIFTTMMMQQQYAMMEEFQKKQLEEMERQMRRGGPDQWKVDYDKQYEGKSVNQKEQMVLSITV